MSVNKLLDITSKSLLSYQRALDVTAHNISNVNSEHYSRQRVLFSTERPDKIGNLSIGSGVKIDDVERVKNQILDLQLTKYNQDYAYSSERASILKNLETLYAEPSELGLSTLINKFFDSWDKLSVDPTSIPLRNDIVNSAQKLSQQLYNIQSGYDKVKSDIKSQAQDTVSLINSYTKQLYEINKEIYTSGAVGRGTNDLLDERDKIIQQLSELVNVNVNYGEEGTANVSIGGSFAVDRKVYTTYVLNEENGKLVMRPDAESGAVSLQGGKLKAYSDIFGKIIPDHKAKLDTIAQTIMNEVNAVHKTGYSIHSTPQTGIDFFSSYQNGNLKINSDILNDVKMIAVSADGTNGNNEIALQLSAIKSKQLINGLTISQKYSQDVSEMGNDIKAYEDSAAAVDLVVQKLKQQKAEYSGVSVDEEMVNVIKFQRSYNAAAKLIQVADQVFQTLIDMA